MAVYIYHFMQKIGHAGHYAGCADDLEARMDEHAKTTWVPFDEPSYAEGKRRLGEKHGNGAVLMGVANSRNIEYVLARVWPDQGYKLEQYLKKQFKNTPRLCPICNPDALNYLPMENVQ